MIVITSALRCLILTVVVARTIIVIDAGVEVNTRIQTALKAFPQTYRSIISTKSVAMNLPSFTIDLRIGGQNIRIRSQDIQLVAQFPTSSLLSPQQQQRPQPQSRIDVLPRSFFEERVPSEILGLICRAARNSKDQASLCRVNRFCYDACTSTLYSSDIRIDSGRRFASLCDTLDRLRPDLALLVKSLDVRPTIKWFDLSKREV